MNGIKGLTPTMVLTLAGLAYWCVFVGFIEPRRNVARSMRPVAALFEKHLPPGAKVYIDTDDGCSSLFYYLGRDVARWRINGHGPKSPIYAVLMDDRVNAQREYILGRPDLDVQVLASDSGPENRTYTLVRVSRRK